MAPKTRCSVFRKKRRRPETGLTKVASLELSRFLKIIQHFNEVYLKISKSIETIVLLPTVKHKRYEEKLHDKDGCIGTGDALQPADNGSVERHGVL